MKDIIDMGILFGVGAIFGLIVGGYLIISKLLKKRKKEKMYKKESNEKR